MIRVNVTGCSLVDNLFGHVDFESDSYRNNLSRRPGDGGLVTGGLVFAEALSDFARKPFEKIMDELTGGKGPDSSNIGGPGIVPAIHAHQVNSNPDIQYRFAGVVGTDENGSRFRSLLKDAGFPFSDYKVSDLPTPSTEVLSDPHFSDGRGERTFINLIGAAGEYGPESLPDDFFDADILLFGGTGLVPPMHDALDSLCSRGRKAGAFVMVTTVFDFRNEARFKGKRWPLVEDYKNVDLLVVDREEALKISGASSPIEAQNWFLTRGCGAVLITQGADDVLLGSQSDGRFSKPAMNRMPTCHYADEVVKTITHPRDTTGCGDNFVGGVLSSLASQMSRTLAGEKLNLEEAVVHGIAAGSLALTCLGGVYYEKTPGEKAKATLPYLNAYRQQIRTSV